jgi:hypothetical protein
VRDALRRAGVQHLLLKGPAFDRLLYDEPRQRPYQDIDLLVRATDVPLAHEVLRSHGFRRFDEESPSGQTDAAVALIVGAAGAIHGGAWVRESDQVAVDLHHSLPQVPADPDVVWSALQRHAHELDVAGVPADVLDPVASALLIAVHAAHHGPAWGGAMRDLEVALRVLDESVWQEAGVLARDLQAERAMGVGLGLSILGQALAESLGLDSRPTRAFESLWSGASWTSVVAEHLSSQPTLRAKASLVWRLLWPTPEALRRGSGLARRGRLGLWAAYLVRLVALARQAYQARDRLS